MELDYILVGNGIAGSCLALNLLNNNKKFVVLNSKSLASSTIISSGLYNPTVLKRFTLVWRAEENLLELNKTYIQFEQLLKKKYLFPQRIYKILNSENDIYAWKKKTLENNLSKFLCYKQNNIDENIIYHNGVGEVSFGGKIDAKNLIYDFEVFLKNQELFIEDKFEYNLLDLKKDNHFIYYKNFKAKRIIFCEGFGIKENPFFNYLPIVGSKGEALLVELKNPITDSIYKSKVNISHFQDNLNYVGSTFNSNDLDNNITENALDFLKSNLNKLYKNTYTVVNHLVGIRPTVIDRRPILGEHLVDKRLIVFNGLGTRGIMNAPLMAKELYEFLENGNPLSKEISVSRFNRKFAKKI